MLYLQHIKYMFHVHFIYFIVLLYLLLNDKEYFNTSAIKNIVVV